MIKRIVTLLNITLFVFTTAQVTNIENYVQTRVYLEPVATTSSTAKQIETVQYFDGLGRPKQVVNVKASPLGRDVVTHIEYDGFGRQVKDYLPVPQTFTANGSIFTAPLDYASNPSIYGTEKIYSEKILENSPLDRIQQQIHVGTAWSNKPVKFEYDANSVADAVKKYTTTTTWVSEATNSALSQTANYGANQLYKNTVTDEDGNKTIEFKNGEGQTLLVRKVLTATENADTYYVYNEYNQLSYVIPPLASAPTIVPATVENLYYQYRYDGRNRLVEKKLPGKGWEYMVYDKADRLIATQDANLRQSSKWFVTKYDKFGRVIYTGLMPLPNQTREGLQVITNQYVIIESRNSTGFTRNGMQIYYTNGLYSQIETILTVNYYDTYPPNTPSFNPTVTNLPLLTDNASLNISTKSLPVASYVKNIEDDNWTKNYSWYDERGRPIGSHSINHLGGYTKTESEIDFSGMAKMVVTKHKRLDSDTERVITENFTYDHQNRLLTHTHKVDNNPMEYLTQNKYNELSQLKTKKVGGTNSATPLQVVDYAYNIRGWMTKINDPANLGISDLFGYKIKYNEREGLETPDALDTTLKVLPKFNGNIAEVDWRTATNPNDNLRRYGYVYDALNRLKAGFYQNEVNPAAKEYFEKITYDLNGNITNLKRSEGILPGSTTAMNVDDLNYVYTGNRLNSVTDLSGQYSGYPDTSGITIPYDLNGNMTAHQDKGILEIDYNFLNLPNYFKFNDFIDRKGLRSYVNTSYKYRADGTKIKKVHTRRDWIIPNTLASVITEYLDGFQYDTTFDSSLQFVPTSEGYYDFVKNKYIYNYTDHLGNVRLSYLHNGSSIEVLEENNYYPFGLKHEGYNGTLTTNPSYQYKYNGKELQETGMYDYGARMYMPDIGRWGVVDPLAEQMRRYSPYNYAFNNPIRFIDPDGRQGTDWYENNLTKNIEWHDGNAERAGQTNLTQKANGVSISISGGGNNNILNSDGSITKNGETITNGYSTITSLGRTITSRNPFESIVNASGNASLINWDSDTVRGFTGDFVNVGGGFSGISGAGGGTSFEANWVLHGPEASFLPAITTTPSVGAGYNLDLTVNVGNANYTGNASDITRSMLVTNTGNGDVPTGWVAGSLTAGGEIGVTGTATKVNGGFIFGTQLNGGVGLPLGPVPVNASAGVSNTYLIKDFYKK
ncbi:DUF6443 domain-containing protein [Chryseobacterium sp. JAH]|uniref:DUF6443 domain-containing protein n=1 Tax=Chryseobacterium sp. JAH TaxID=1742858 RepID=UPI000740E86B|nr:DUF6443 domain-containing protein [Chryseobacterium sp. JAH]KUJ51829.1 hypothetical protein AR685_09360 [Chryseobacterium sp. JAH]